VTWSDVRRTVAVVVLVAALAAAGCGGGGEDRRRPGPPPLTVGLVANTLGYGTDLARAQDAVAQPGVRTLREELHWGTLEPRPGARRWAAFDRLMIGAAHRGLQVLVLLHGTPAWAERPNHGLPTATDAYGRYVHDVVARYGPGGTFWRAHPRLPAALAPRWFELWNEPWFAPPVRSALDARRYAALAMAGLRGGRAASPDARFLVAVDTSYLGAEADAERWLRWLDRADPRVLGEADGVAAHPYSRDPVASVDQLRRLAILLRARGRSLPVWVTEVGWSTCAVAGDGCVSPARQARNLRAFLDGVRALPRAVVPAVFVYSLRDLPGPLPPREEAFGMLRLDGTRKPAWAVLRAFASG
jgi:hypothetical protein